MPPSKVGTTKKCCLVFTTLRILDHCEVTRCGVVFLVWVFLFGCVLVFFFFHGKEIPCGYVSK